MIFIFGGPAKQSEQGSYYLHVHLHNDKRCLWVASLQEKDGKFRDEPALMSDFVYAEAYPQAKWQAKCDEVFDKYGAGLKEIVPVPCEMQNNCLSLEQMRLLKLL